VISPAATEEPTEAATEASTEAATEAATEATTEAATEEPTEAASGGPRVISPAATEEPTAAAAATAEATVEPTEAATEAAGSGPRVISPATTEEPTEAATAAATETAIEQPTEAATEAASGGPRVISPAATEEPIAEATATEVATEAATEATPEPAAQATAESTEEPTAEPAAEATPEGPAWTFSAEAPAPVEGHPVQYNLASEAMRTDSNWAAYHPGEQLVTDCNACHTTGFRAEGNQNGLPGLIGTWNEPGVGCEACHGPGGNHVNNPYQEWMRVERDGAACGSCHSMGDPTVIQAQDGFVNHQQQFAELFSSKKRVMDCVDCHNPHATVKYAENFGALTSCETCHFEKTVEQKKNDREHASCVECHMPNVVVSGQGDLPAYRADMQAHIFAINPRGEGQFNEDGTLLQPWLTVEYACGGCHGPGNRGPNLPLAELVQAALGYHDPALAGSLND
jgi:hypothetical protein